MRNVKNTSYKVQVDVDSDAIRNSYKIEEGAYVTTESGVYTVYGGEWVRVFPQYPISQALGWARYDDDQYTSANKLSLSDGVSVIIPNNGANVYRSNVGVDYYDSTTKRVLADNVNNTYIMTLVFKCSAANANQTLLDLKFEGENGTPYDRITGEVIFSKGNDLEHNYHRVFQYYADNNFINNGSWWEVTATGGTAKIWDIIFFIQKTQSYA